MKVKELGIKELGILVNMQVKDKLHFASLRDKKKLIFQIAFLLISVAAITAASYLVCYAGFFLRVLSTTGNYIPTSFMVFLFTVMQIMSLVTVTFGLSRALYFSDDNNFLLTLPAKANSVFFSKLIVYYISELKKSFLYIVPVFIGFGLYNGLSFAFYIILIIAFVLMSLFNVLFGALLSIPVKWIIGFARRHIYVQVGLFAALLIGITVVFFLIASVIPPDLDLFGNVSKYYSGLQSFLRNFQNVFAPFKLLTEMIVGNNSINPLVREVFPLSSFFTMLVMIGIIGVLAAAVWFGIRPFFFKMATNSFEFKLDKRNTDKKKNVKNLPYVSVLKKELLLTLRNPSAFASHFMMIFLLPLAIYLLNQLFSSMDTRITGDYLAMGFNMLIILIILLPNNASAASVISGEGATSIVQRANPSTQIQNMLAKLSLGYVLSTLSVIFTCGIVYFTVGKSFADVFFMFAAIMTIHTAHILWSVDMDIDKPRHHLYKNGFAVSVNPNEIKSVVAAFSIAFIVFAFSLLLLFENAAVAWIKLAVAGLAFFVLRWWLNFNRLKVFNAQQ